MVSQNHVSAKEKAPEDTDAPHSNDALFNLATFYLGQINETLNRLLRLPGPTGERLKTIDTLRIKRRHHEELLETLKARNTAKTREQLEAIEAELKTARERLEDQKSQARQLAPLIKSDESFVLPLKIAQNEVQKIEADLIPSIERKKAQKEAELLNIIRAEMSKAPDVEAIKALDALADFVSDVGKFELEERQGGAIDEGLEIDFAQKSSEFQEASAHHRDQAQYMLWAMVFIIIAGAAAIAWLFGDLKIECIGKFPGQVETFTIIERLVLTGVGRIAVLALIAWSLAYIGSLHRSHSEQAVLYHDRKAALGVITNLMRAATDLQQKHDLLQSIARGYLGFDQNAFRISPDSSRTRKSKKSSAASQIKELADVARPLVDMVSKIKKE